MSDSLRHHESQHARPPCPSPTPGVHSDSHPLSQWCHPAISSSVIPFFSCPQFLPASKSFPMSQLFAWGGQSTGLSALASFLPEKSQGWSPSEWTGWISSYSSANVSLRQISLAKIKVLWGMEILGEFCFLAYSDHWQIQFLRVLRPLLLEVSDCCQRSSFEGSRASLIYLLYLQRDHQVLLSLQITPFISFLSHSCAHLLFFNSACK